MILLTNEGNKMSNHLALALSKIAALELHVSLKCMDTEPKELKKMEEDDEKLYLFFSDNTEMFEKNCEKVVVLWELVKIWPGSYKVLDVVELKENNGRCVNSILRYWGFNRKVLPDFKLKTDNRITPLMDLKFTTGQDYLLMKIEGITWKGAEAYSQAELKTVELRLVKEFLGLAETILRKQFKAEKK